MDKDIYCERAKHMERKGINTELFCHCSDDVDFQCTALEELKTIIEHLAGCCEKQRLEPDEQRHEPDCECSKCKNEN